MAKLSGIGTYQYDEIRRLCFKVLGNASHIDKDDIKVLEFLSKKGDYEKQTVKIINKDE